MSLILPYLLGAWCAGWCGTRLCRSGTHDSRGEEWKAASMEEAQEILHYARLNMGAYALTPAQAVADAGGVVAVSAVQKIDPGTEHCPAHIVYLDHDRHAVVVAVRGLDMGNRYDFHTLCDNHKGKARYAGGYVHHGLLTAAKWLLQDEGKCLAALLQENTDYHLVFVGHSLGAGIAMLATMLVADDGSCVGGVKRDKLKGFGVAPPRAVSLDLAVKYADVINGVILQDDFLPRMSTTTIAKIWPLAERTGCFCRYGVTCACCFIVPRCLKDSFISDSRRLRDPRRLYPAGRLYHVVVKEPWRFSRPPPKMLTAVPVKGRFEKVVITSSTFVDHNLTALIDTLVEKMVVPPLSAPLVVPPTPHRMERLERQRSRREDRMKAEGEMEQLAPARQKVEAQKVARDEAREESRQGRRPSFVQTAVEAMQLASLGNRGRNRLEAKGPQDNEQQQASTVQDDGDRVDGGQARSEDGLLEIEGAGEERGGSTDKEKDKLRMGRGELPNPRSTNQAPNASEGA